MRQLLVDTKFDFMGKRRYAAIVSGVAILISIVSLVAHGGPRLGIDFSGGTLVQILFDKDVQLDEIRGALSDAGIDNAEIQRISSEHGAQREILIRMQQEPNVDPFTTVKAAINAKMPDLKMELRRQETVGPKIGKELRGKAIWAVLFSLIGILIYVSWRYEFKFALGAVLALFHDVIIVLGLFSVLNKEISLTIIAALLTIGGYSVNDTIVVFDRIREQMRTYRREKLYVVFNMSINQTLSRTIITALTTLFAVLALFLLGGEVLHDFAFGILAGIIVGTYSSIFVASAAVLEIAAFSTKRPR
jgi:preprotein translocase SecF subunit